MICRRGDISPADRKIAVRNTRLGDTCVEPFQNLLEVSQLRNVFDDTLPEGYDQLIDETDTMASQDPQWLRADNGQLYRNLQKQLGYIDSPRTKAIYGFFDKNLSAPPSYQNKAVAHVSVSGLSVECRTDFGVIAMSSLTDDPIETSQNILLSTIGRARNTGAQFDGEKMLEIGRAPITVEVIDAVIHLKTIHGEKLKVWGVNAEGFYSALLPTTYEDGVLTFRVVDEENPSPYYLIVAD